MKKMREDGKKEHKNRSREGGVVSSGGAPTSAGTSVFTKINWDMGMGYLWLGGALIT